MEANRALHGTSGRTTHVDGIREDPCQIQAFADITARKRSDGGGQRVDRDQRNRSSKRIRAADIHNRVLRVADHRLYGHRFCDDGNIAGKAEGCANCHRGLGTDRADEVLLAATSMPALIVVVPL